jgi:hypothetical protein
MPQESEHFLSYFSLVTVLSLCLTSQIQDIYLPVNRRNNIIFDEIILIYNLNGAILTKNERIT